MRARRGPSGWFRRVEATTRGWDCEAVSFIPAWVNRSIADAGRYTGNCYLKTGPASTDKLDRNSNVHAAIRQSG